MKINDMPIKLQLLTQMFTAYIANELYTSNFDDGYDELDSRKIKDGMKLEVITDNLYLSFPILFNPTDKLLSERISLHTFFEEKCLPIIKESENWSVIKRIKADKSLKIKFIKLPDYDPFLFIHIIDVESNTKIRGIYGSMFGEKDQCLMFDMQIYLAKEI
jgi:hypothetical protein